MLRMKTVMERRKYFDFSLKGNQVDIARYKDELNDICAAFCLAACNGEHDYKQIFRQIEFFTFLTSEDFDSEGNIVLDSVLIKMISAYKEKWMRRLNPRDVTKPGVVIGALTTSNNRCYLVMNQGKTLLINSENS